MKRFIACVLLIATLLCFTACGSDTEEETPVNPFKDFGFELIEATSNQCGGTTMYHVYDTETKVEYFIIKGTYKVSMAPRYDENGNVAIYKGE